MDRVSDINKVNKLSKIIYKKTVEPSTRKNKKYMILNDNNKYVHFGDSRYEDFTKHQDLNRLNNYLSRATKIKGNWKKDKYSPNNLAINLLWNKDRTI
jgi:acid phosphatase class B